MKQRLIPSVVIAPMAMWGCGAGDPASGSSGGRPSTSTGGGTCDPSDPSLCQAWYAAANQSANGCEVPQECPAYHGPTSGDCPCALVAWLACAGDATKWTCRNGFMQPTGCDALGTAAQSACGS